jgi:putative transposase
MFTMRPGHLRSFDYLGLYRYFLTFCTHARHPLFTNSDRVVLVSSHIFNAASADHMAVIAYCFMPDHVHLLVEGQAEDSDCLRFIRRAKQSSGFHYQRQFGHRLWQRYGFERVLRHEEATLNVAKYILENPIRAGLVTSVEDYPFLGSSVYRLRDVLEAVSSQS